MYPEIIIGEGSNLPVGACIPCMSGSITKNSNPEMEFGKCIGCGQVTDCIRGDEIALFIPYIPLMEPSDIPPPPKRPQDWNPRAQ